VTFKANTVRTQLVLLFFAITAAAIGFVYLYVVPQLRSSLTAAKLQRLEDVAIAQGPRFSRALQGAAYGARLERLVRSTAQKGNARATLLGVEPGPQGPEPQFVIADSEIERTAITARYPAAAAAAAGGHPATAVERVAGERLGEAALALSRGGSPRWVLVLSSPLGEVDSAVALIKRQILIAGGIALGLALGAAWLAAGAHARRLRRLEAAAEKVAEGDFRTPIPDEGKDEVGQLAAALDEMQRRLARLDSARKAFIANASHELRTPISSLAGFAELLDEDDPAPETRAEFVRTMREQIARLTKLTADLLDLSKLDADTVDIRAEPVELAQLAERVAAEFGPAAERHRSPIRVRSSAPALARADPDRVAQIMRILIDNALTHTPAGTSIAVSAQTTNGSASLIVADDGPGVDAHARGRVFERFFTADKVSGSGLGLAIARELALRMAGQLDLSSRRGRTEFTLRLPAERGDLLS
jgi:two-component system OmpR family sensor kinase